MGFGVRCDEGWTLASYFSDFRWKQLVHLSPRVKLASSFSARVTHTIRSCVSVLSCNVFRCICIYVLTRL